MLPIQYQPHNSLVRGFREVEEGTTAGARALTGRRRVRMRTFHVDTTERVAAFSRERDLKVS